VYAVGAPASLALAFSLTRGIVSGYPVINDRRMLQTDAPVNPGNSGGPIVDASGAALGVVSSKMVATKIEGLAFAVPLRETLSALGLIPADETDPQLLSETARVAEHDAKPLVVDTPDDVPSLDPEGDELRASIARQESEDEARHKRARQQAAERDRPSSDVVGIVRWGGLAVAGAGALGVVGTYLGYNEATTTHPEFRSLQLWNSVGWGATLVGAGAFLLSFAVQAPATTQSSSVSLGPGCVVWQGSF
jgi:hypothetical protein